MAMVASAARGLARYGPYVSKGLNALYAGRKAYKTVKPYAKGAYNAAKYLKRKGSGGAQKGFKKARTGSNRTKKVKKGPGPAKVDAGVSGASCSQRVSITLHKRPKKGKFVGRWRQVQTHTNQLTTTAGKQDVTVLFSVATNSQLNTDTTAYTGKTGFSAIKKLNPSLNTTGGGALAATAPLTHKFLLKHIQVDMEFTNVHSATNVIEIFAIGYRTAQQLNKPCDQIWIDSYPEMGDGGTIGVVAPAGAGLQTGTYGTRIFSLVGSHPMQGTKFRRLCKVLACKKFFMTSNQTCSIKWSINVDKVIKNDWLVENSIGDDTNNASLQFLPGLTVSFMAVTRGQVAVDTTTGNIPTYAPASVSMCSQVTYLVQGCVGGAAQVQDVELVRYNIPSGALNAAVKYIDVDTNAAVAETSVF